MISLANCDHIFSPNWSSLLIMSVHDWPLLPVSWIIFLPWRPYVLYVHHFIEHFELIIKVSNLFRYIWGCFSHKLFLGKNIDRVVFVDLLTFWSVSFYIRVLLFPCISFSAWITWWETQLKLITKLGYLWKFSNNSLNHESTQRWKIMLYEVNICTCSAFTNAAEMNNGVLLKLTFRYLNCLCLCWNEVKINNPLFVWFNCLYYIVNCSCLLFRSYTGRVGNLFGLVDHTVGYTGRVT